MKRCPKDAQIIWVAKRVQGGITFHLGTQLEKN